jgi:HAE1 family hydrophobic/amphiphilic exporter-1
VFAVFDLRRDIDVAAQDVRDRVGPVIRQLPDQALDPIVSKFNADHSRRCRLRLAGNLSVRELTEVADKIVRPRIERSAASARSRSSADSSGRSTSGSTPSGSRAYRMPISEVEMRCARRTRTRRRQRHGRRARAGAAHGRPRHRSRGLQRPRHPDRQRRPDPHPRHRPAEDGTKEQRSLAR